MIARSGLVWSGVGWCEAGSKRFKKTNSKSLVENAIADDQSQMMNSSIGGTLADVYDAQSLSTSGPNAHMLTNTFMTIYYRSTRGFAKG